MNKYLVSNKYVPINNKLVLGGSIRKPNSSKLQVEPKINIKPNFGRPLKFLV